MLGRGEDTIDHRFAILINTKWIESRCRIGIEQCGAQCIVVDNAAEDLSPGVFVPTNPCFPLPRLQLVPGVGELAEIAL